MQFIELKIDYCVQQNGKYNSNSDIIALKIDYYNQQNGKYNSNADYRHYRAKNTFIVQ
jgi:hypothetical protein